MSRGKPLVARPEPEGKYVESAVDAKLFEQAWSGLSQERPSAQKGPNLVEQKLGRYFRPRWAERTPAQYTQLAQYIVRTVHTTHT